MVELREVPVPQIGPQEVLLRVRAAGVCGADIEMWHNVQSFSVNTPVILGHEFAGIVEQVGSEVKGVSKGNRVVSETHAYVCGNCRFCRTGDYQLCPHRLAFGYGVDGAFATHVKVRQAILHSLPEFLSFEEGALIEPLCVAYTAVAVLSRVSLGDTVVIIGPGPVGLNSLQIAKIVGAGKLIVLGTKQDTVRLNLAKKLGADRCINVDEEDPVPPVLDQTGGVGADLVVNAAGNSASVECSLKLVRRLGQITNIAWGPNPLKLSLDPIVAKSVTLQGSFSHNWHIWERVIALMATGKLKTKPLVTLVLPIREWEKGFVLMDNREAVKVVLEPVS